MSAPSIRRSLLIRCGLGVGLLLCLLSAGIYVLVEKSLYGELDDSIKQTASILANQVELENDAITYEWEEGLGTNQSLVDGAHFQFWNEATGSTTRSPGLRWRDLPKFSGLEGAPVVRNIQLSDGRHARAVGLRVYPFVLADEIEAMELRGKVIDPKTLPQILVVARDAEPVHHALERLRWVLVGGSLLTLAIGYLLIERAVRSSLRPIHELASQVRDRAEHQLDRLLELPGDLPSELGGLAVDFNLLLSRVAAIRERERDFIRHAAHELRTPIAGLRATTDLALSQQRDAAEYAGYLRSCQSSAVELGELVKRLSALARIGRHTSQPLLEPVELGAFATECWHTFEASAAERGLRVETQMEASTPALADRALLRIVLNNLFDNAVAYAALESPIRIRTMIAEGGVALTVSNGIEEGPVDMTRLFEPLFRREASRHDAGSHLGIGLTLSLEAARAMNGILKGESSAREIGFVLLLPMAPPP